MQRVIEAIKRIAMEAALTQGQPRWGIVDGVDVARPAVRLKIQPEGTLTGWLPLTQQAAGAGASSFTVPKVGWQAAVMPDLGDAEHPIVMGFAHNDGAQIPPTPNAIGTGGTPSTTAAPLVEGETVIIGADGTVIRLGGAAGPYIKPGGGTLFVDGHVKANGDLIDQHGSLDRLRGNYDAHRHPDPQGGISGLTDHVDAE